jgi:YD repeat-containing protein
MARDSEFAITILSLLGRAGLDLGLGLSFSSAAVYTRSGPYIYFDEDNSSLSPGFRIGFPTVQEKFFNAQISQNAYLLITSAGSRVELRQVGSSNIYEAADSSYLQLTDNSGSNPSTLLLRSTDGTQMSYSKIEDEWRCTKIEDRNGNLITVNYNSLGDITTIVDTLNRTIIFNYDSNTNLISIAQSWNGVNHNWATFGWGTTTIAPGFSGVSLSGIANNQSISVLTQVGLDDGSRYNFEYTTAGQVSLVRRYTSDNVERSHTAFDYGATDDSLRLAQTRVAADNWTGINGVPAEVTTTYGTDGGSACWLTAPDGTIFKEFYGTGWKKGLTTQSEVWSGSVKQKWTTTAWMHDGATDASYPTNPRVTETNIYDASLNRRRTAIGYTAAFTPSGGTSRVLPSDVYEYASDATAVLRRTHTDYNLDSTYLNRWIIGLPATKYLCDGAEGAVPCSNNSGSSLFAKSTFQYDETGSAQYQGSPVQHDDTNYGSGFLAGRANLSSTRRYDVVNSGQSTVSSVQYNTAGSVITATDPLGHQSSLSYSDSFSADGVNPTSLSFLTLAYPTSVTDADGFSSSVKYHYDFGAKTRVQGPPPANYDKGIIIIVSEGLVRNFEYQPSAKHKDLDCAEVNKRR